MPISRALAGFTLIELIGVLAIITILAGVLVPSALRSLDRAAEKAEATTLQNLGEATKLYLRTNKVLPGTGIAPATAVWNNDLAAFADLSPPDVLTTTRQQARVLVIEPGVNPPTRALLISSMRTALAVPTAASINTAPLFNDIWSTQAGTVPSGASLGLWTAKLWGATAAARAANAEYLTIQLINLQAINSTDLQTFTVTLNNTYSPIIVSYHLISGTTGLFIASNNNIPAAPPTVTIPVPARPRDRLDLYTGVNYGALAYSYIFSANSVNALTFTYQDSTPPGAPYWRPQ